ncbi:MAG: peptidoglycan-binding protein [Pseudomonadota bacterium]
MAFSSVHFGFNDRLLGAQKNAPPLKRGDFGHPVRLVQQALVDLGYRNKLPVTLAKYNSPDGIYGNETKEAVRKFQSDQKLGKKDGIVGENTITRLDQELVSQNIQFRPLPPLPTNAKGGEKDDEANVRRVILDTLGASNPLRSMTWMLKWHQLSTDTVHRAYMSGHLYDKIGEGVYNQAIGIVVDPTITSAAYYVPSAGMVGIDPSVKANTFVVSRPLRATLNDRSLVIHESTHAVCDYLGKSMNAFFSEILAFVAEAIFMHKVTGQPKSPQAVYRIADEIAQQIIANKEPDNKLIDDLSLNLRAHHTYGVYTHGTVQYDGIPI